MKHNWKLVPSDYAAIKERLERGERYRSIASTYNVSRERIRQIAKTYNLQGVGLSIRSNIRYDLWIAQMQERYGEFFDGKNVNNRDLLQECKLKYSAKKYNAKRSGLVFDIEFQDIIWNKICPITDLEIDYFANGRQENSPSFDRTNPELGYIKGNVQIISWRANRIKNDGTREEHQRVANYMLEVESQVI